MVEIRALTYFAAVIEHASISRAAETIGISQPALTKSIRLLEKRLGVRLLERGPSGVTPTVFGDALYARAKSITSEVARVRADIEELSGVRPGVLSVGVLPSQAATLLPLAMIRVAESAVGLRIRVVEKARGELISSLRRGDFDVVVSVIEDTASAPDLVCVKLVDDRPTAIIRHDHPLAETGNIRVSDLVRCPWLMPPAESVRWGRIERMFREHGVPRPRVIMECRSVPFLKSVVIQSNYVGLLPNDAPTVEENAGLTRSVILTKQPAERTIGVMYRSEYPLSAGARRLVRELRNLSRLRAPPLIAR